MKSYKNGWLSRFLQKSPAINYPVYDSTELSLVKSSLVAVSLNLRRGEHLSFPTSNVRPCELIIPSTELSFNYPRVTINGAPSVKYFARNDHATDEKKLSAAFPINLLAIIVCSLTRKGRIDRLVITGGFLALHNVLWHLLRSLNDYSIDYSLGRGARFEFRRNRSSRIEKVDIRSKIFL